MEAGSSRRYRFFTDYSDDEDAEDYDRSDSESDSSHSDVLDGIDGEDNLNFTVNVENEDDDSRNGSEGAASPVPGSSLQANRPNSPIVLPLAMKPSTQ